MNLEIINAWIQSARELVEGEAQIPLITVSVSEIEWASELTAYLEDAYLHGDYDLREALEDVLSRDPDDVAARFIALSVYHQLTQPSTGEDSGRERPRGEFWNQLSYFVRLRDIHRITTIRDIRWEITNAWVIKDSGRALAIASNLQQILDANEYHYIVGRLHFLSAFTRRWQAGDSILNWDLPIGPAAGSRREAHGNAAAFFLYATGVGLNSTRAPATQDDIDHLHDAIKHLRLVTSPLSARFMLARSYLELGDGHNAARHYQWLLRHRKEVLASWDSEVGWLSNGDARQLFVDRLYKCLVDAREGAGDIRGAIAAAEDWIAAFPGHLGTNERLARLHQATGDYHAAYQYLRMEVERNPTLGEDPHISMALAFGAVAGDAAAAARALEDFSDRNRGELRHIVGLLGEYWPSYNRLDGESREEWALGTLIHNSPSSSGPTLAVFSYASVVERELRRVFENFRTVFPLPPTRSKDDDPKLVLFMEGRSGLTLGQMLTAVRRSADARSPLYRFFGAWLQNERPRFISGLPGLRTDEVTDLRNRVAHALHRITADEATSMMHDCRALIDLVCGVG